MEEEIWKDIPGYEGFYQVSNFGRVKSLVRKTNNQYCRKEIILKYSKRTKYFSVILHKNGKAKNITIHRLVATCFVEGTGEVVNHIDGNKHNNRRDNLEWCSQSFNIHHAVSHKLIDVALLKQRSLISAAKISKPIVQLQNGKVIAHWDSTMEASKKLNMDSSCICKVLKGKKKTAYGFEWRYVL